MQISRADLKSMARALTDPEAREVWRSRELNANEREQLKERMERHLKRCGIPLPSRKGHNRLTYFMALRRAMKEMKSDG